MEKDKLEQTFVMLKPDTVQRGLIGEIISRLERKGFKICALKMVMVDNDTANLLYECHKDKPFFENLKKFTTSSPVVVMVVEGLDAVQAIRRLIGSTVDALPGTIRGDFSLTKSNRNLIHASDSKESAIRELNIFFEHDFVQHYHKNIDNWVYSEKDLTI
jgi:nucleoside-diphosphate kinase